MLCSFLKTYRVVQDTTVMAAYVVVAVGFMVVRGLVMGEGAVDRFTSPIESGGPWLGVCVGHCPDTLGIKVPGEEYVAISNHDFSFMVQHGIPPPQRIDHLCYTTLRAGDDPLFMSWQWREYVSTHVDSVAMDFLVHGVDMMWTGGPFWPKAAPHLRTLNLDGLLCDVLVLIGGYLAPGTAPFSLPQTLKTLIIHQGLTMLADISTLRIPSSVERISMHLISNLPLSKLPVFPKGLRSLELAGVYVESKLSAGRRETEELDVSELMGIFPSSLEELQILGGMYGRPAMISAAASQQLSPQLKHNMFVYNDGISKLEFGGVARAGDWETVVVDLSKQADYSGIRMPEGVPLQVMYGHKRPEDVVPVPLQELNHWFPRLESLELRFPRSMEGVRIPPSVEVVASCLDISTAPPELWEVPRIVSLSLGVVDGPVPALLGEMEFLKHLGFIVQEGEEVEVPAPPNLESLKVKVDGAEWPDLRLFESVVELEVVVVLMDDAPNLAHLPPNLRSLRLVMQPGLDRAVPSHPIDLRHLVHLEFLQMRMGYGFDHSTVVYPDNLRKLELHSLEDWNMGEVQLPANLEHLTMSGMLSNPWMVCGDGWLHGGPCRPMGYPASLSYLGFVGCTGLVPPPRDFVFPPRLESLVLRTCGISDITPFRFPSFLRLLDLLGNHFVVPDWYVWPRVLQLTIRDPKVGDSLFVAEDRALIQKHFFRATID